MAPYLTKLWAESVKSPLSKLKKLIQQREPQSASRRLVGLKLRAVWAVVPFGLAKWNLEVDSINDVAPKKIVNFPVHFPPFTMVIYGYGGPATVPRVATLKHKKLASASARNWAWNLQWAHQSPSPWIPWANYLWWFMIIGGDPPIISIHWPSSNIIIWYCLPFLATIVWLLTTISRHHPSSRTIINMFCYHPSSWTIFLQTY